MVVRIFVLRFLCSVFRPDFRDHSSLSVICTFHYASVRICRFFQTSRSVVSVTYQRRLSRYPYTFHVMCRRICDIIRRGVRFNLRQIIRRIRIFRLNLFAVQLRLYGFKIIASVIILVIHRASARRVLRHDMGSRFFYVV